MLLFAVSDTTVSLVVKIEKFIDGAKSLALSTE
jgi:hypothetical protein